MMSEGEKQYVQSNFGVIYDHDVVVIKVGLSITVTSLTDVIAFLLGSLTIIPAIRYFCIYAALCILFDYVRLVSHA